jgi:hypothetical protein
MFYSSLNYIITALIAHPAQRAEQNELLSKVDISDAYLEQLKHKLVV